MARDGGRRRSDAQVGRQGAAGVSAARVQRDDVALYLARLASEMVELARMANLPVLAYLADMTRLEAEQQARALRRAGGASPAPQSRATRPPGSR